MRNNNSKIRKIYENLSLAKKNLTKLNNYEVGYTEEKTIWYPILSSKQFPIVTNKIKIKDLPVIPISKIDNLYPIQFIDGGDLNNQ